MATQCRGTKTKRINRHKLAVIQACNALKYIYRHRNKNGVEDIKKADWYLKKYLELAKSQEEKA